MAEPLSRGWQAVHREGPRSPLAGRGLAPGLWGLQVTALSVGPLGTGLPQAPSQGPTPVGQGVEGPAPHPGWATLHGHSAPGSPRVPWSCTAHLPLHHSGFESTRTHQVHLGAASREPNLGQVDLPTRARPWLVTLRPRHMRWWLLMAHRQSQTPQPLSPPDGNAPFDSVTGRHRAC